MKQQLNKKNFDQGLFYQSLERAIDIINEFKEKQPAARCRLETTVQKESVKVYVIEKSKICKIIDICGADAVVRDI